MIPIISIKNLSKTFPRKEGSHRVEALRGVDLTVHKGEFLVLLGPSGCGKSTLLRMIAGLEKQTGGEIIYGKGFEADSMSFVFQNFGLLPWFTVAENIALNLKAKKLSTDERSKKVHHILELFDLLPFKHSFPHQLSGGMKQRVGLARAFVAEPSVILLDEPFSELDFFTAENLRAVLLDMWQKLGTTVVMVSHYIDEAVALADRVAVFSDRPSSIKAIVHNELPRPRDHRSASFFKLEDEVLAHFGVKKPIV